MKTVISCSPNKHFNDNEKMNGNVTNIDYAHYLVSLAWAQVVTTSRE